MPFDRSDAIKMQRESSVWTLFTKKAEFIATCNTCNQDYSYKASISNLRKHWNNKHGKHIEGKSSDLSENNSDNSNEEQDKAVATIINKKKPMASWKYFDPLDLEKCEATCIICNRTLTYEYMSDLKQHVQDHGHEPNDSDEEFVPGTGGGEKTLKRKFKSKLWQFFRATDDKMAECLICHNYFNFGSTISNLGRHLVRKHGDSALISQDGGAKNIITYEGNMYEAVNERGLEYDEDELKDIDAIYLDEEELDEDPIAKPPSPKKKQLNLPPKRNSIITKEQVHRTKDTCSGIPELSSKPIVTFTPNTMGSLDYFGQYVVALLKELPKPVSDQLQSVIIKQILDSKMALETQTVGAKYEIVRSQKNDNCTNVPEPVNFTIVQNATETEVEVKE